MANDPDLSANQVRVRFRFTKHFVNVPGGAGAAFVFPGTNDEGATGAFLSLNGTFTDGDHISGSIQYRAGIGKPLNSGTFSMERQSAARR